VRRALDHELVLSALARSPPCPRRVEIGGDGQSTEGTEPSHMHSVDDLNFQRGYEFWLLSEAKKRNPSLLTFGLSWAWPAWLGCPGGDLSSSSCDLNTPYTYPNQTADYIVKWVQGVRDVYNVTIDVVGSWNEKVGAATQWGVRGWWWWGSYWSLTPPRLRPS
jgi:galactosylceramidase